MKKQSGFSLLEILVVIAIISIIAGVTSDIFIQIIKGQNKGNIITEVKQNGDLALNRIERIIRNAEEITAIGERTKGQALNATAWTDASAFTTSTTCPANPTAADAKNKICAVIVKNPTSIGGYTKIQFNQETDSECGTAPFTAASWKTTSPYACNGNIRIVEDSSVEAVDRLKNIAAGYTLISSTTIGQVITNTEIRSGVSLTLATTDPDNASAPTEPLIKITSTPGKPALVNIKYALQQGIDASSRIDSQAISPFDLTVSLRTY